MAESTPVPIGYTLTQSGGARRDVFESLARALDVVRPARPTARLELMPNGRWRGQVNGPGNAGHIISTPDLEKAVYFIVRRLRGAA